MLSKRAYLVSEGKFEIRTDDLQITPDQLLVKIKLCGLCNWELNFFKGTGDYYRRYPLVVGHEWVGEVVEVGKNVKDFAVGEKVTVLPGATFEGFAEYTAVNACECYKINKEISDENAMGEPLKCIATVLRSANAAFGDFGLIFGCGPMGLWCTQGLKGNYLAGLIAVDVDDEKLALAKKFGATHTVNPLKEDAQEVIRKITNGNMCDFVIEGTGNPSLLGSCISFLKNAGRLVIMSSYETTCKELDLRPAIEKGISIKVAHPASTPNAADDMRRAVSAINCGTFSNDSMITHRFKLEDIEQAFKTLENKPKGYIKGIIEM